MITKSVFLASMDTGVFLLGYVGENEHIRFSIKCDSVYDEHPEASVSMLIKSPSGTVYPKVVTREDNNILWSVTASDTAESGNGQVQITFTDAGEIIKTVVANTTVLPSLVVNGEAPDPIAGWVDDANAVLAEVEEALQNIPTEVQEQIAPVVEAWLEENITNPDSPPLDRSLNLSTAAAPADLVGSLKSAIDDLQERLEIAISHVDNAVNNFGMSSNAKQALLEALQHIAWIDNAGETYYDAIYDGFYNDTWPITQNLTNCVSTNALTEILNNAEYYAIVVPTLGYTLDGATVSISMNGVDITQAVYDNGTIHIQAVTGELEININANNLAVESLTALFDQGGDTIYTSDTLNSLKPYLTVTAEYVNGASKILDDSEYTIIGTIAVGQSTLTVSYGGKTANFTVTAVQGLPQGYTSIKWIETDGGSYTQTSALSGPGLSAKYKVRITGERTDGRNGHIFTGGGCVFPFLRSSTNTNNHNLVVMNRNGHNNTGVTYYWQLDTDYEISAYIQGDSILVNGTNVKDWTEGESTSVGNMYLFCAGSATDITYRFIGRFYYLELYDSGTLVHKYMPCINSSDIVGVYDTVTDEFFSSNTNTPFVAGGVY